jgi:lipoprotein-anchoring transpeptidase ErfK/SrfK
MRWRAGAARSADRIHRAPARLPARSSRRAAGWALAGAGIAVAVVGSLVGVGLSGGPPARPGGGASAVAQAVAQPAGGLTQPSAGLTAVAMLRGSAARYSRPGQRAAGNVPGSWYGRPSVLPVIATSPGWVEVRLAQRPDGSTTWLPDKDVRFGRTPYLIVINLADMHLSLYRQGRLVLTTPAGVGTPEDPTPPGQYFVAFVEPPPSPAYGAFVMVTSDHSEAIKNWEGSGDAVIGIHGPLGEDALIGTTGARISHGCIRLHEQALVKLRGVPPGTPIDIIG